MTPDHTPVTPTNCAVSPGPFYHGTKARITVTLISNLSGTRFRMKNTASLTAAFLAAALAACILPSPDSTAAPESDALLLTFTQRDSLDQVASELGTYVVTPAPSHSLQGALAAEVSIDGYGGATTIGRASGDPERDVVVFLLIIGPEGSEGRVETIAFKPTVWDAPVEAQPTGQVPTLPIHGTAYAFFIEGIGDPPDAPVDIVLRGTDTTQRLLVDSTHMLSIQPAFRLDETLVPTLPGLGPNPGLIMNIGSEPEGSALHPYPGLIPMCVWRVNNSVGAGTSNAGLGMSYRPPLTGFEFFLFFIEE